MAEHRELVQLLMEVGYVAAGNGFYKEAVVIFEGVRAIRPDSPFPEIGAAVLELNRRRANRAITILRDSALVKDPESDLAKSFLGLALRQAGYTQQSRNLLEEVVAANRDPVAVDMAAALLSDRKRGY